VWIGLRPGTGHGWLVGRSMVAVPLTVGTDIQYASWRLDSPTMSGPSKESSPSGHEHDSLLMRVKRLRQDAESFQRTLEEELRTTRTLIDDLRVGQAKRRRQ
jgi:hypothetical protein